MPKVTVPSITLYRREAGTRTFLRVPHAKNDLPIDENSIPQPFKYVLKAFGNVRIPKRWKLPSKSYIEMLEGAMRRGVYTEAQHDAICAMREYAVSDVQQDEYINIDDSLFRQMFVSALKFIRRDCHNAQFTEGLNPELDTDPENGGTPNGK